MSESKQDSSPAEAPNHFLESLRKFRFNKKPLLGDEKSSPTLNSEAKSPSTETDTNLADKDVLPNNSNGMDHNNTNADDSLTAPSSEVGSPLNQQSDDTNGMRSGR